MESITLIVPLRHSFWLPLTVVFVLRPDWSFTVVRGVNRLAGNLVAVAAVPALLLILGTSPWAILVILIGRGGTFLLLGYATNPVNDLFAARFVSTLLGALISLLVVLAIPTWARLVAPGQVKAVVSLLNRWRSDVMKRSQDPASVTTTTLEADVAEARHALIQLDQTVTGVLLEPGDRDRPVELASVFAPAGR